VEEQHTWTSLTAIIRRRRKVALRFFLGVWAIALTVAILLPPTYRSQSRILIEEQQIPQEYVKTAVTTYVEERLQQIHQQVLSRSSLADIIKRFALYPELQQRQPLDEIVEKMRQAIELKTVSADVVDRKTGKATAATVAFIVSYEGDDPGLVQKVTDTLSSLYLNENLRSREQRASGTTAFLQQEADNLRAQTESLEAQISVFKSSHIGSLPEQDALNLQAYERANHDIDRLITQVRALEERKIYLEGQLSTVDPSLPYPMGKDPETPQQRLSQLKVKLSMLRGVVSNEHPDVKALKREISELEAQIGPTSDDREVRLAQIRALKEKLAIKSQELGTQHPDVVTLRREVDTLSRELAELSTTAASRPNNPAYINLSTQLASTTMEITGLLEERRKTEAQLREHERKLSEAPATEQKLNQLMRDYQTARRKYEDVINKLMEAKVSQGMEQSQQGERFTIIDPAELPDKPYKPNRLAIAAIGMVLALGCGVGVAGAMESLDQSVKSAGEMETLTDLPVLCVLPFVEERANPGRSFALWILVATVLLAALGALALIHFYFSPLDVLWLRVMRRLG
jgi:uncharacterized protein involved in exopolysaccharide biosynthesis